MNYQYYTGTDREKAKTTFRLIPNEPAWNKIVAGFLEYNIWDAVFAFHHLRRMRKEHKMAAPKITRLELVTFEYQVQDMGKDYNGFNHVYAAGSVETVRNTVLKIHTSLGVVGEYPEAKAHLSEPAVRYHLRANPFEREKIYNDLKRGMHHTDRTTSCRQLPVYSQ